MALYGYIAPNKRPSDPYGDYFSETRKMIDAKTAIDQASKAAEDAALESIGELPELGPNSMFMSYGDAYKQMATYLRDNKDELLATEEGRKQYQQLIDGATQWSAYGKDHTAKVNPLLSTRMKIARSGVNPQEWESQGLKDKHSYDEYVAKTSELDSARFNVTVKDGQWVVNDKAGEHSINDESLFDLSFFKDFQVETSPDGPSVWYTTHKPKNDGKAFKDEEDAKEWAAATIMSGGGKGKRDAVRWYVNSDKNTDGLTADQINSDETGNALDRAVDAYAEEAVSGWEKFVEKSKDDKKAAIDSLVDGITPGMSVTTMTAEGEGSVQATYAPLDNTGVYVGWSDGLDGDSAKYKVDGIYLDDESNPIIALITSKGTEYVPVGLTDDLYNEIEAKMADKYGKGALRKLLIQMD